MPFANKSKPLHVGIITYETGHLKTLQLILKLLIKCHKITLFAFPFKLRPHTPAIFVDRPYQIIDLDMRDFCIQRGIGYQSIGGWSDDYASALGVPGGPNIPDVFLTCIAKIIPESFIRGRTILNCHPGLLPHNRGLDAFKWCVINEWAFGITLHKIDAAIDRGTILHRMRIPVLPTDNLKDVALRAYEMEVDLMADFAQYLPKIERRWHVGDTFPLSRRLVPRHIEAELENMFSKRRDHFIYLSKEFEHQPHEADEFYRKITERLYAS